MGLSYTTDNLIPLDSHTDEDGTSHTIYRLPSPKKWTRTIWIDKSKGLTAELELPVPVEYIRVSLGEESDGTPIAFFAPFDEHNEEDRTWGIMVDGIISYQGVLSWLGYTPASPLN